MSPDAPRHVTLPQFTLAFAATALALLWALLTPEFAGDLDLGRTSLTIWATSGLLAAALALHLFRSLGQGVANLAHLFWTGAFAAFLTHAFWAVFLIFDGVADTFAQQGPVIAGGNFLLLGLWTLDVALLWTLPQRLQPRRLQTIVRALAFLIFAVTLVVLRGGPVQTLGFVFVGLLGLAALVRLGTHAAEPDPEEARP